MCFNDAEIEKAKEMPNTVNYYIWNNKCGYKNNYR